MIGAAGSVDPPPLLSLLLRGCAGYANGCEIGRDGAATLGESQRRLRRALGVLYGLVEVLQSLFGVGEEHHGLLGIVEERVIHACEAWTQGALDEDYTLRVLDREDGHSAYGALHLRVVGGRIYHVIGADDDRGVGVIELGIYLFEVVELLVGDADLGQEDVHVTWHTTGHRVDAEEDLLALGL